MKRARTGVAALAIGAALVGSATAEAAKPAPAKPQAKAKAEPKPASEIDPRATELLERMRQYLTTLKAFTVNAETTRDELVHGDFKLQKADRAHVVVKMPNRMRAEVLGDAGRRLFVYDGQTLALETANGKTKGGSAHFAIVPAPQTLRETLDSALEHHGVELPLADMLYAATGGRMADQLTAAGDIGPSQVAGIACEHLAFRTKAVDWQVCIEQGERPLPRKLVVTTRGSPSALQSSTVLDWDLKAPISDGAFTFKPSEGATRINFASPIAVAPNKAEPKATAGAHTSVHNANASVNRDVNVNRNVNGAGYDSWGHPVATAAAPTGAAVAVGTMVAALPSNCTVVAAGGIAYQRCGNSYYQPIFRGTAVQYVVVAPP
jgi:hypothetical protein